MYTMIHVHRDDIDFLLMASVNEWFCLITVILHVYTDRADKNSELTLYEYSEGKH